MNIRRGIRGHESVNRVQGLMAKSPPSAKRVGPAVKNIDTITLNLDDKM